MLHLAFHSSKEILISHPIHMNFDDNSLNDQGGKAVNGVKIYYSKWTGMGLDLGEAKKQWSLSNLLSPQFNPDSCKA